MQYGKNIVHTITYSTTCQLTCYLTLLPKSVTPGGAGGSANASSHSVNGDAHGDMTQVAITTAPVDGLKQHLTMNLVIWVEQLVDRNKKVVH